MIRLFNPLAQAVLNLPRRTKRVIAVLSDACLCVLSVWLAFYLRLDEFVTFQSEIYSPVLASAVSVFLALPLFVKFGLYRAIFRYSGLPALMSIVHSMFIYGVLFIGLVAVYGLPGVPRTVGFLQPILLFIFIGASRATARMWLGSFYQDRTKKLTLPQVLIYGAGSAGRQLASAMVKSHEMHVVGYLDDDDRLHGHVLNGLPIYNPEDLNEVLSLTSVTDVLLALPSVSRKQRNDILATLLPYKLMVRTLPALSDIATGKVSMRDVRELDIDDLLGREPVKPNVLLLHRNTHNKTVLVTGAGGSIGSELCRQILRSKPKRLLLVDMSEVALYQIHQDLQIAIQGSDTAARDTLGNHEIEIVPLLASVCDEDRMHEILDTWRPHTLYHTAAYKHVPLVEHNPAEGVHNNVWGTLVCAEAAGRNGVQNFVLISTDKAVRPTNIMGASKRLAEMVLQALAQRNKSHYVDFGQAPNTRTCYSMVRFGNVLGSSGSVVPLFRQQIKNGGPITLTHPDITRYFMTISEAVQLVIQAGSMGTGGDVFVLDMGLPVRIQDLANRMVELSGLTVKNQVNPNGDIEMMVTGLRPGEKLYEELLIGENPTATQHARIMKAQEPFLAWSELEVKLSALRTTVALNDVPVIRRQLQEMVSGYQPAGDVVDWVHLAQDPEIIANA